VKEPINLSASLPFSSGTVIILCHKGFKVSANASQENLVPCDNEVMGSSLGTEPLAEM
jgi:hypothetical protein